VHFLLLAGAGDKERIPAEAGGGFDEVGFVGVWIPLESMVTAE
jgi:hypothetical protein